MARQRDYKQEYARRIARGLARGLTRKQARGHAADRTRRSPAPVAASPRSLNLNDLPAYVGRLREDRSVKVVAAMESGRRVEIARGKAGPMLDWFAEIGDLEERFGTDWGPSTTDHVVAVQVIYQ